MANESVPVTIRHINRVRELLRGFADALIVRGHRHDRSKFDPAEQGPLDEMQRLIETEGQAPFGSEEYERRKGLLGPMLEHHYANNSHHPEHWPNGVTNMDLIDLVEMFIDWKAASERGEESAINLTFSIEKYAISPQLASILRNTAARYGWAAK